MLPKLCAQCLKMFSFKRSLNHPVKNIHGPGCDACKKSKFAYHSLKWVCFMEMSQVVEIFMVRLKQGPLMNLTPSDKMVKYTVLDLLSR